MSAGTAANAIPDDGVVEGTVRCLDDQAWHQAPDLLKALLESVSSAYGVLAELTYVRNVPPTVNESVSTAMIDAAAERVLGPDATTPAPQSLGGEDFAWYLESVPGSLCRLGTRRPGSDDDFDIHQPAFDVDERAIGLGVRLMAATALTAICGDAAAAEPLPGGARVQRRRRAGRWREEPPGSATPGGHLEWASWTPPERRLPGRVTGVQRRCLHSRSQPAKATGQPAAGQRAVCQPAMCQPEGQRGRDQRSRARRRFSASRDRWCCGGPGWSSRSPTW